MRAVRGWVPAVNADAIVVTVHDDIIMVMVMTMKGKFGILEVMIILELLEL